MILRRLIANLQQQNWAAIWIEFVLLVVGVFLGVQMSNWNQSQAEARLGRDYVQRLIRDLEVDRSAIRTQIDYYNEVLNSTLHADELLRAPNPDPRELVVNAYRATELTYTPSMRATWDQIVSSGRLGLLPKGAVESGLSSYYAFDTSRDVYLKAADSPYRQTVRKTIPLTIQVAMRAGCSDAVDEKSTSISFVKACKLDVDPVALRDAAEALRSDPAVIAELRYQYTLAISAVLNLGSIEAVINDALATLGARTKAAEKVSP